MAPTAHNIALTHRQKLLGHGEAVVREADNVCKAKSMTRSACATL